MSAVPWGESPFRIIYSVPPIINRSNLAGSRFLVQMRTRPVNTRIRNIDFGMPVSANWQHDNDVAVDRSLSKMPTQLLIRNLPGICLLSIC